MAAVRKSSSSRVWSAFLSRKSEGNTDSDRRTRDNAENSTDESQPRFRIHHQLPVPRPIPPVPRPNDGPNNQAASKSNEIVLHTSSPIRAERPQNNMIHITSRYIRMLFRILSVFLVTFLLGCGTTRERMATDQLLLSDAVDRSVARIDFSPLAGETVFLDSQYVRSVKTNLFVNADYIISSLRQQMLLAGCLLQDSRDEADIIVEARVGTLGQDAHDLNVGLPANNTIQTAAELVNNAPPLPAIPEISLLKKSEDSAAAKIAVFAFRREAKTPVWQSGLSVARSTAKNKWIFGAGPFQSGEIYKGTYFAGERLRKNTFNPSYPPHVLDEQAFRNAAVLESDLTQKLRESPKVEHVAKSGSTSEKLRRIPDSEVATTDEIEKTPNVVTAEHVESVESTRVE